MNQTSTSTANWKTYTNRAYGFTFKYPDLTFGEGVCGQRPLNETDSRILILADQTTIMQGSSCYYYNYAISFYVNKKPGTIEDKVAFLKNNLQLKDSDVVIDDFKIGNKTVKRMQVLKLLPGYYALDYENYYFYNDQKSNLIYSIFVEYSQKENLAIINKILSTVNFDHSLTNVTIKIPFYKYFPKDAFTTSNFIKRNYDKTAQPNLISKNDLSPLDKISDDNLVEFKCSYDLYQDRNNTKYYYAVGNINEPKTYEIPIAEQLYHLLHTDPSVKYNDFRYCLTSDNQEYILAAYWGGPLELIQINGDKVDIRAKDPQITGMNNRCGTILAITKDNNFYISCNSGGDSGSTDYLNRIDANSGLIKEIIGCTTLEGGTTKCTSSN